MPEKPASEKKTLDEIWYAFYGVPGSIGLLKRVEELMERIATIESLVVNGNGDGKKARRLKLMGGAIVGLIGLSELGILEGLKAVVVAFFTGAAG